MGKAGIMMELVRRNIHMNRQKGKAVSQMTLDDDYNIPDNMPDAGMIIQEKGSIDIGDIRIEAGRVKVKGALNFSVLYMDEGPESGLHSVDGQIPFEEMMNVENAKDGDNLQLKWMLEHDGIDFADMVRTCSKYRGYQCGVAFAEGFKFPFTFVVDYQLCCFHSRFC